MEDCIIQEIYRSCDPNNTNAVQVLSLIEYIKPYMNTNLNELNELHSILDPTHCNPPVTYSFFQSTMKVWVDKMQKEDLNNSFSNFPSSSNQSLSLSKESCIDKSSNNNNTINVKAEEQILNLQYQLNKALTDLGLVKEQLISCEEQNEALILELNRQTKSPTKEETLNDTRNKSICISDQCNVDLESYKQKIEILEKKLSECEKEKFEYQTLNTTLDGENNKLKQKLAGLERSRRLSGISLNNMKDNIDLKDTEIDTLTETIESLKHELKEKVDLLHYYTNEHKLLKQKKNELEHLLQSTVCKPIDDTQSVCIFNTPKLLQQLANPVSPSFRSPLRGMYTSSPSNSTNTSFDLSFSEAPVVVAMLRQPHKTLQEEFAEISDHVDELGHMYKVVKDQEDIKNSMWQDMKQLSKDNESLQDYKKECLMMKNDARRFSECLTKLEHDLMEEKMLNGKVLKETLDIGKELKVLKVKLWREKKRDLDLYAELTLKKRNYVDKCCGTGDTINWLVPSIQKGDPQQRTNYAKQQIKLERLVEKQEHIDKELKVEKDLNTKLVFKLEQATTMKETVERELSNSQSLVKELQQQEGLLKKKIDVLQMTVNSLSSEKACLVCETRNLNENFTDLLNKLNLQKNVSLNLYKERDFLLNKQNELELELQSAVALQGDLSGQLLEMSSTVRMLEENLSKKNFELQKFKENLSKKDFELQKFKEVEGGNVNDVVCCNDDLKRVMMLMVETFNLDLDMNEEDGVFTDGVVPETGEIISCLKNNVHRIRELLSKMLEIRIANLQEIKFFSAFQEFPELSFDDTFSSCASDVSCLIDDFPDIAELLESTSFLGDLHLEGINWKSLSQDEIEETFASLFCLFATNTPDLEKRFEKEKDKFGVLVGKFFSQLNYTFHLVHGLNNHHCEAVIHILQSLKVISEDLVKSAVHCAVLQNEQKTTDCWRSVINHVGVLSRQLKQLNVPIQISRLEPPIVTSKVSSTSGGCLSTVSFWLYSFFVIIAFVIVFLFYVESQCPKNGQRVCPLDWMLSLIVKETYNVTL